MAEENTTEDGLAKKEGRVRGIPTHALKKDIKAGKVTTGESEPTASTETPDPNVTSVGDTTDSGTSGTVTGDANTTRSTTRSPRSGATTTTDGT